MRCPRLSEFPPPPKGKTGWPWIEESEQLPDTMPDGTPWPRISIVTPSYNQGQFIEETIRSVLLQGYPELEYIIIDGGSMDESVEIIKKYSPWIKHWVSESDGGQTFAINNGMNYATGEIRNWLNSDDYLEKSSLFCVSSLFKLDGEIDMVSGARIANFIGKGVTKVQIPWLTKWPDYLFGLPDMPQEASFFSEYVWEKIKGLDEAMSYHFDVAFFYKVLSRSRKICLTDTPLSVMNVHEGQKTKTSDKKNKDYENERILDLYVPKSILNMLYVRILRTRFHYLNYMFGYWRRGKSNLYYGKWSFEKSCWLIDTKIPF